MSIEPTVGRIVLYHPTHADPGGRSDQAVPAIISRVNLATIDLTIFAPLGVFQKQGVVLNQQDDEASPLELGQAHWMEYQRGQAAKHDAPAAPDIHEAFDALAHIFGGRLNQDEQAIHPNDANSQGQIEQAEESAHAE
jgi:hypothetical protein